MQSSWDSVLYNCSKCWYENNWSWILWWSFLFTFDLQKAFDTVNQDILLCKLDAIGIDSGVIQWFWSYLMDRKQFVEKNNIKSKEGNISCGVPQGSILGPLLFLIYVNDMENCLDCDLYL